MMLSPSSTDELSPPRPMPKQGGWGENTAVSMEDPRFNTQSPGEEISEIPTIPVLEEMAEEDLSFQVMFLDIDYSILMLSIVSIY